MARAGTVRGRSTGGSRQGRSSEPLERTLSVGRPLQARLIALEKRVGVFSEEQSFAADSRFNHPVILSADGPVPAGMARVFGAELGSLERMGKDPHACHALRIGAYDVCCVSFFHYDGFRALLYVEHEGSLIAAWKDEEVLHPDSPRLLVSAVPDADIERFLEAAEAP